MKFVGRWLYVIFALLFWLCILVQFYLAGMATFAAGSYWSQHATFVHLFGLNLPVAMMIAAFMGRAGTWDYFHILVLFFLIMGMYVTANVGFQLSYVGSLHPIVGTFLFVVASSNLYRSIILALNRRKRVEG